MFVAMLCLSLHSSKLTVPPSQCAKKQSPLILFWCQKYWVAVVKLSFCAGVWTGSGPDCLESTWFTNSVACVCPREELWGWVIMAKEGDEVNGCLCGGWIAELTGSIKHVSGTWTYEGIKWGWVCEDFEGGDMIKFLWDWRVKFLVMGET